MQKGFSLIEIILSVALFGVFVTGLIGAVLYGQESSWLSGVRARATFLAEEGLEVARNTRDAGYSGLVDGTYGLTYSNNIWGMSGSSDTTGVYTRQINVSTVDSTTKKVTSTVSWQQNGQRSGTVTLSTYLTNQTPPAASGLTIVLLGAYLNLAKTDLLGITLQNSSTQPLTVHNITVTAAPNLLGRTVKQIKLGTTTVYANGTMTDYTLAPGASAALDVLFSGASSANIFTVVFTMSDGSTQTVVTSLLL